MAIERHVRRYELLIRFDSAGDFQGAHTIDLVTFVDTEEGTVSPPQETPARGVTEAEFGELIGAEAARLIEAATAAQTEAAEALAQLSLAQERVTKLEAEIAGLKANASAPQ